MNFTKLYMEPINVSSIVLLLTCLIVIVGILSTVQGRERPKYVWPIVLYLLAMSTQLTIAIYDECIPHNDVFSIENRSNISAIIFIVAEALIFCNYFYTTIKTKFARKFIFWCMLAFTVTCAALLFLRTPFVTFISVITLIEGLVLIPVALLSIYELFGNARCYALQGEQQFWITVAILQLMIVLSPLYALLKMLRDTPEIQMIDHFSYIMCVILIAKSFKSKRTMVWYHL